MPTLVFDIGGTKTRAGLFDCGQSALTQSVCTPTPNHLDYPAATFQELRERLVISMHRLAGEIVEDSQVTQLNVAFAGPIDAEGKVLAAPTIWGALQRSPHPLHEDLKSRWPNARVSMMNDVTAAGYRYRRSREDEFCIVTVSSGIGNKVFSNGRPLLGKRGAGGELGHLRVDESPDAPLCECGGRGHLGAVSSGRAVLDYARANGRESLTNPELVKAFRRGEPWAVAVIAHGAAPLGWALAAMHLGLGLERFILVGGFALALGETYRLLVAQSAAARAWDGTADWSGRVELGVNDDFSGLIGAGIAGLS
ncbi:MAG TPA: ROK family protein [Myxococcales bacterium]|nr:ROK family protein [Myxococcales bacterium]